MIGPIAGIRRTTIASTGRIALALVVALAATGSAALSAFAYSPPKAPAGEQAHPYARPAIGGRHTTFVLRLTAGDDLGVRGVFQSDYSIDATNHPSGCSRAFATRLSSARKGQRISLTLTPPARGWCSGRYSGVVLLERGPYCPKPAPGQQPRPCPEFASQALDVGRFAFRVR
jgi:hypothetical protein